MKRIGPMLTIGLVSGIISILTFAVWKTSIDASQSEQMAYAALCERVDDLESPSRWHMIIYIDINSCLSCNEDMSAWRSLAEELPQCNGRLSFLAPREDSIDVAWAMELEGLGDKVEILSPDIVKELGWAKLGTPVKVLLDSLCRPVEIKGRLGNAKSSRWFIDDILKRIRS